MVFEIGTVDFLPYIAFQGLNWRKADLNSKNSGRTLDGIYHRGKIGDKVEIDVVIRPLTTAEANIVLNAIDPEIVVVRYTDPRDGLVVKNMFCEQLPASYMQLDKNGVEWWNGISFTLTEV